MYQAAITVLTSFKGMRLALVLDRDCESITCSIFPIVEEEVNDQQLGHADICMIFVHLEDVYVALRWSTHSTKPYNYN